VAGERCVECGNTHGIFPIVVNRWHRCTGCGAIFCPDCGRALPGKERPFSGEREIVTAVEREQGCFRGACAYTGFSYGSYLFLPRNPSVVAGMHRSPRSGAEEADASVRTRRNPDGAERLACFGGWNPSCSLRQCPCGEGE